MSKLACFLPVLLAGCAHLQPLTAPSADELTAAMAYGQRIELDALDPAVEKNLLLRLYAVPRAGEQCFVETQGVCANTYYLSVSTYDEAPVAMVYRLKHVGEVRAVRWLDDATVDQATLELRMDRYTALARQNNPALNNIATELRLVVTPAAVVETVK